MRKVYYSKDKKKITFAVKSGDVIKNVSFSNFGGSFSTSDKALQSEIEKTFYFESGLIYTNSKTEKKPKAGSGKKGGLITDHPEITDINSAVELLVKEFGVDESKIESIDDVLLIATENEISFSNLVLD